MAAADGTVSFAGDVGGDMVEWVTEYASDVDDIGDGTYCFEHDCPPTAQGLAQTEFLPVLAMVPGGLLGMLIGETFF